MTDPATGPRVAVAGGTGVVGRLVVAALAAAGAEPVVLARSAGVDLVTGHGLAAAIRGVVAVIDVSNVSTLFRLHGRCRWKWCRKVVLHSHTT